MLQQFFGTELDFWVRLAVSLIVIIALLGVTAFIIRRMGKKSAAPMIPRPRTGRARLSVVDAVPVDQDRRLVLVRRDDTEHLLLTGGTADVVVEANIPVRGEGSVSVQEAIAPLTPEQVSLRREAAPAVAAPAAPPPLPGRPEKMLEAPPSPSPSAPAHEENRLDLGPAAHPLPIEAEDEPLIPASPRMRPSPFAAAAPAIGTVAAASGLLAAEDTRPRMPSPAELAAPVDEKTSTNEDEAEAETPVEPDHLLISEEDLLDSGDLIITGPNADDEDKDAEASAEQPDDSGAAEREAQEAEDREAEALEAFIAAEREEQREAEEAMQREAEALAAIEAEQRAEEARIALETAEREAAEQAAREAVERAEIEAAALEAARLEAEAQAEAERLALEAAEREAAEAAEREAAEQAAIEAAEREAWERAEAERLALEAAEREAAEQAAIEAAEREAWERAEAERIAMEEAARLEAEAQAEAEREAERLALEAAEREELERAIAEAAALEAREREEAERVAEQKAAEELDAKIAAEMAHALQEIEKERMVLADVDTRQESHVRDTAFHSGGEPEHEAGNSQHLSLSDLLDDLEHVNPVKTDDVLPLSEAPAVEPVAPMTPETEEPRRTSRFGSVFGRNNAGYGRPRIDAAPRTPVSASHPPLRAEPYARPRPVQGNLQHDSVVPMLGSSHQDAGAVETGRDLPPVPRIRPPAPMTSRRPELLPSHHPEDRIALPAAKTARNDPATDFLEDFESEIANLLGRTPDSKP